MKSDYVYPINMGNDDEITINETAKLLIKLFNSQSKVIYNDLPKDDPLKT